jgi:hypothetical protein
MPYRLPVLWIDEKIIPGSLYMEVHFYVPGANAAPRGIATQTHDVDEILGFVGTDLEHPHDLGGELELTLGDEKHTLTKSCLVFIPKGLQHLPLVLKRVDKPIIHFSILNGGQYLWTDVK